MRPSSPFAAVFAVTTMCITVPVVAQDIPTDLLYFKVARTLHFSPDTLLIASIDHMDVDPSGRLLIVDQLSRSAYLFDSTGNLQASLDPAVCHPGFTFRPLTARFGGDDFIFVQNSGGGWGFRFTTDGHCLGRADLEYTGNREFSIDPKGILYDISYIPPDFATRVLRVMNSTGQTTAVFPLPPSKLPDAVRRVRGGGLIANEDFIYYATAVEAEIFKISVDGTLSARLPLDLPLSRLPRRDLSTQAPNFLREFSRWSRDVTLIEGFFELTDEHLFIQYRNSNGDGGYQVLSKDGTIIAEETGVSVMPKYLHGEYGWLYRVIQPSLDEAGNLPNPFVQAYHYITP